METEKYTTIQLRKLAQQRCKDTGAASSWVASARRDTLVEYLKTGVVPSSAPAASASPDLLATLTAALAGASGNTGAVDALRADLEESLSASTATYSALESRIESTESLLSGFASLTKAMSKDTGAIARLPLALAASKSEILGKLTPYYSPGKENATIVLLTSPPSLGKSYSVRILGKSYDTYLEHGCSPDPDEISTLLGTVAPDGKGSFMTVDGVLTQAVRTARTGKTVLLLLDEVFRLSHRAQEWLLTFLTGVKVDGALHYRLRTKRVLPCGNLEVITCKATHLHLISAGNLGGAMPVEPFWSRFEKIRLDFSAPMVASIADSMLTAYGIEHTTEHADKFAKVVGASREHVKTGTLSFPVDMRLLERACRHSWEQTWASVKGYIADRLPDNCAAWDSDTGDSNGPSIIECKRLAEMLN